MSAKQENEHARCIMGAHEGESLVDAALRFARERDHAVAELHCTRIAITALAAKVGEARNG